jgi:hypothetical protein
MVRTMIGGLLAANNLRLPYFAAAVLALLNWLNGYLILPESLPKDRRTAIDFKKVNPFSAIIALTQVRGNRQFGSGLHFQRFWPIPSPDHPGALDLVSIRLGTAREWHFAFCGWHCQCGRSGRFARHPFEETR